MHVACTDIGRYGSTPDSDSFITYQWKALKLVTVIHKNLIWYVLRVKERYGNLICDRVYIAPTC